MAGVVQPAHGLTPSAAELRDMVQAAAAREDSRRLQRGDVSAAAAQGAAGRSRREGLHHHATSRRAPYTADKFEREMQTQRRHDDSRAGHRRMTDGRARRRSLEIDGLVGAPQPRGCCSTTCRLRVRRGGVHVDRRPERRRQEHAARRRCSARSPFEGRIVAELAAATARSATCRRASPSIRRCRSRSTIFSR